MKKFLKYGIGGTLALLVIVVGGYLAWTQATRAEPAPDAVLALESDERVSVEDGEYVVFRPSTTATTPATTGVIVYPGAGCDVRGYAPVLRRIAARGYLVVGVPMPFDMAVLAPDRADAVRAAFPAVDRWVLIGHSMGGAMAARYAHRHPGKLSGLLLWDSYPPESDTLADATYPVWHIHRATADGRAPAKFETYRNLFPATSTWIPLPGGIHMYFGSFVGGGYEEEWLPTISREAQQDLVVTATLNALLAMQ